MKTKLKKIIFNFSLVILLGIGLASCGKKTPGGGEDIPTEENVFYINSFTYDVKKNESSVANELAYSMSFDIGFAISEKSTFRDLVVRIAGTQEKSFRFTIDYCNTENITLSQSTAAYPYALLNYTASPEVTTFNASVNLKITTADLIDDINKFLKIDCYSYKCKIKDVKNLTDSGVFKMSYSDNSASDIVHYAFNDLTESYEVVSVITKSSSFEIPATYMNYPVKTIDEGAFKGATGIEELVLPSTLTSIPEGLLNGMSNLKSLTIPFVGQKIKGTNQVVNTFGYIFGNTDYTNGIKIKQVSKDTNNTVLEYEGCFPKGLTKVIVTGDSNLPYGAFSNCTMLEEIELTGNISEISDSAFINCTNVKSFSFPDAITSIGKEAFSGFASNTNLNSFKLPENLEIIGESAFENCDKITFEIPESFLNSEMKSYFTGTGIKSILIPFGIASIGEGVFKECSSFESITLPKSIKSFGQSAFEDCSNLKNIYYEGTILDWCNISFANESANPMIQAEHFYLKNNDWEEITSIEIPNAIRKIGDYQFVGFGNISSITIPSSLTSIGNSAFEDCLKLANVYFEGTIADWCHIAFDHEHSNPMAYAEAFYLKNDNISKKVTSIEIPDTITELGSYQFYGFNNVTSIIISNSVQKIEPYAFVQCSSLTSITTPFVGQTESKNTFIGYLFGGKTYLDNDTILPDGLTEICITNSSSIDAYAFASCSKITKVTLESNVKEIKEHAFDSCVALQEITFNDDLETIGDFVFLDCISLADVTIPAGIQTIGEEAFSGCTKLVNLTFNCKNALVKQKAFYGCRSIETLVLNDQIATFEEKVFSACSGLTSVTLNNNISISKNLFEECLNIQYFKTAFIGNEASKQENFFAYFFGANTYSNGANYVPNKLTTVDIICDTIPDNAFYGLVNLTMLFFTGKTIGVSSFERCGSLKVVSLEEVETIKDNAFANCSSLEEISLPASLKNIGSDAFNYSFAHENENRKKVYFTGTIDDWAEIHFVNNYSNPMSVASAFLCDLREVKELSFASAAEIKQYAFYGFTNVNTIQLSNTATTIGEYAFANMSSLVQFEAGDNLTTIHRNAFRSDSKLQEVVLNAKIISIGEFAFMGCTSLETLRYNATVNDWVKIKFLNQTANPMYAQNVYMLDESNNSYLLENVYLDDSVTEISAYAFFSFSSLKELHITSSLLKIGNSAFEKCTNLKDIYYEGTEEQYLQIENNTPLNDVEVHYNS